MSGMGFSGLQGSAPLGWPGRENCMQLPACCLKYLHRCLPAAQWLPLSKDSDLNSGASTGLAIRLMLMQLGDEIQDLYQSIYFNVQEGSFAGRPLQSCTDMRRVGSGAKTSVISDTTSTSGDPSAFFA